MASDKPTSILEECVVSRQAPLYKQATGEANHPRNYTTTLYDSNGKLLDDGELKKVERSYWEAFVDPQQASELQRRLDLLDSPDYIPGSEKFLTMEVTGGEEDDTS